MMEEFNLPAIAEKYNQDLATLSNIQKIELKRTTLSGG